MSRDLADPEDELDIDTESEEDLEDLALGEDYALNPQFVSMVVDAADRGDSERLRDLLSALHPADVADLMGFLSADYREEVLPHLDPEALAEILSEMDHEIREEVLEAVAPETVEQAILETFDLSPRGILRDLNLRTAQYLPTAAYGHFGRDFSWEETSRVDALKAAINKKVGKAA